MIHVDLDNLGYSLKDFMSVWLPFKVTQNAAAPAHDNHVCQSAGLFRSK